MKRHYTRLLPVYLLDMLKDAGFPPMMVSPTFAHAMDWLASKEIYCEIHAFPIDSARFGRSTEYEARVIDAREMYNRLIIYEVKQYMFSSDYKDLNLALEDTIKEAIEMLKTEK